MNALAEECRQVRMAIVRAIHRAGTGHVGGSLSCVEILVTLYHQVLNVCPSDPLKPDRDRLVLSKGHGGPALYAVLARCGFFPDSELATLSAPGTRLSTHCDRQVPGVEFSTGSLGQGLSLGVGLALGARMQGRPWHTWVVLGDGETDEGQVWEAAMAASKYRLDNLSAVVDMNRLQVDGPTQEVMPLEPYAAKWRAFGWTVSEADGHDCHALLESFRQALKEGERPAVIFAHTVKGKGVSFAEGRLEWHNRWFSDEEASRALAELEHARG